jgi:hypothetical protein
MSGGGRQRLWQPCRTQVRAVPRTSASRVTPAPPPPAKHARLSPPKRHLGEIVCRYLRAIALGQGPGNLSTLAD